MIVAFGGGGFSDYGSLSPIDSYVLSLVDSSRPRVCFVPTASGDSKGYLDRFYNAFSSTHAHLSDLQLFKRTVEDIDTFLRDQDVVYVGGGNTVNMAALWELHKVGPALRAAHPRTLLCGISAGAMCWFDGGLTDSFAGYSSFNDGLGLVNAWFCPHWDSEPDRRALFVEETGAANRLGFAVDDGVALVFRDNALVNVVSEVRGASAFRVERGTITTLEPHGIPPAGQG